MLQYQPLEIAPSLPAGATPPGALVLQGFGGDPSYFLEFEQGRQREIPPDITRFSTSPDGQWLAYMQAADKTSGKDWLIVVESADGQEVHQLPLEPDWFFGNPEWFDNQRLVFNLLRADYSGPVSILPLEIVNPFTGERLELASDYPDMRPSLSGPGGSTMDFLVTSVVYHPSLDLVVYPKTTRAGFFVVLWDRRSQQALASLTDLGGFNQTPLWRPDGELFVYAAVPEGGIRSDDFSKMIDEWFSVSREGEIQQLTHFGDFFEHAAIGRARWSPDGQRLAFWLATQPTVCGEGEYLAMLEMRTQQVINYCVYGSTGYYPPPIWSPDSRYVAFLSEQQDSPVILVSVEQGWAARIGEDRYPAGWLATLP